MMLLTRGRRQKLSQLDEVGPASSRHSRHANDDDSSQRAQSATASATQPSKALAPPDKHPTPSSFRHTSAFFAQQYVFKRDVWVLPLLTPLAGLGSVWLSINYAPRYDDKWACEGEASSGMTLPDYPCKGSSVQQMLHVACHPTFYLLLRQWYQGEAFVLLQRLIGMDAGAAEVMLALFAPAGVLKSVPSPREPSSLMQASELSPVDAKRPCTHAQRRWYCLLWTYWIHRRALLLMAPTINSCVLGPSCLFRQWWSQGRADVSYYLHTEALAVAALLSHRPWLTAAMATMGHLLVRRPLCMVALDTALCSLGFFTAVLALQGLALSSVKSVLTSTVLQAAAPLLCCWTADIPLRKLAAGKDKGRDQGTGMALGQSAASRVLAVRQWLAHVPGSVRCAAGRPHLHSQAAALKLPRSQDTPAVTELEHSQTEASGKEPTLDSSPSSPQHTAVAASGPAAVPLGRSTEPPRTAGGSSCTMVPGSSSDIVLGSHHDDFLAPQAKTALYNSLARFCRMTIALKLNPADGTSLHAFSPRTQQQVIDIARSTAMESAATVAPGNVFLQHFSAVEGCIQLLISLAVMVPRGIQEEDQGQNQHGGADDPWVSPGREKLQQLHAWGSALQACLQQELTQHGVWQLVQGSLTGPGGLHGAHEASCMLLPPALALPCSTDAIAIRMDARADAHASGGCGSAAGVHGGHHPGAKPELASLGACEHNVASPQGRSPVTPPPASAGASATATASVRACSSGSVEVEVLLSKRIAALALTQSMAEDKEAGAVQLRVVAVAEPIAIHAAAMQQPGAGTAAMHRYAASNADRAASRAAEKIAGEVADWADDHGQDTAAEYVTHGSFSNGDASRHAALGPGRCGSVVLYDQVVDLKRPVGHASGSNSMHLQLDAACMEKLTGPAVMQLYILTHVDSSAGSAAPHTPASSDGQYLRHGGGVHAGTGSGDAFAVPHGNSGISTDTANSMYGSGADAGIKEVVTGQVASARNGTLNDGTHVAAATLVGFASLLLLPAAAAWEVCELWTEMQREAATANCAAGTVNCVAASAGGAHATASLPIAIAPTIHDSGHRSDPDTKPQTRSLTNHQSTDTAHVSDAAAAGTVPGLLQSSAEHAVYEAHMAPFQLGLTMALQSACTSRDDGPSGGASPLPADHAEVMHMHDSEYMQHEAMHAAHMREFLGSQGMQACLALLGPITTPAGTTSTHGSVSGNVQLSEDTSSAPKQTDNQQPASRHVDYAKVVAAGDHVRAPRPLPDADSDATATATATSTRVRIGTRKAASAAGASGADPATRTQTATDKDPAPIATACAARRKAFQGVLHGFNNPAEEQHMAAWCSKQDQLSYCYWEAGLMTALLLVLLTQMQHLVALSDFQGAFSSSGSSSSHHGQSKEVQLLRIHYTVWRWMHVSSMLLTLLPYLNGFFPRLSYDPWVSHGQGCRMREPLAIFAAVVQLALAAAQQHLLAKHVSGKALSGVGMQLLGMHLLYRVMLPALAACSLTMRRQLLLGSIDGVADIIVLGTALHQHMHHGALLSLLLVVRTLNCLVSMACAFRTRMRFLRMQATMPEGKQAVAHAKRD